MSIHRAPSTPPAGDDPAAAPAMAAVHGRWDDAWFSLRAWLLQRRRGLRDLIGGPRRHPVASLVGHAHSESVTALWPEGQETSAALVAGKIHNLRLAVRQLHGLRVPAGATFGFWRQLGRATARRGYVRGRELREGCVVPSIGGGLCQLSNAIYDAALRHGLEIVERHRHSRVMPGSLAERDRDAVVFWNYLDLRLRAPFDWRLECWLDAEALHVRIVSATAGVPAALPLALSRTGTARAAPTGDCSQCDRSDCHRHAPDRRGLDRRTWVTMAGEAAEFVQHRQQYLQPGDRVLGVPAPGAWQRLQWHWRMRRGWPLPKIRQAQARRQADWVARRLGPEDVALVLPQALLPGLWRRGELQGRSFEVTVVEAPMWRLQQQLQAAQAVHPASATLGDFRAAASLVDDERRALAAATGWIGAHRQVLALAGTRARYVPWVLPSPPLPVRRDRDDGPWRLCLAGSALARKGALELSQALQGLPLQLWLPPGAQEAADLWQGLDVVRSRDWSSALAAADLVVLPAWVEHRPHGLLLAMQAGIPVLASPECGLDPGDSRWQPVVAGDAAALRAAIVAQLPPR